MYWTEEKWFVAASTFWRRPEKICDFFENMSMEFLFCQYKLPNYFFTLASWGSSFSKLPLGTIPFAYSSPLPLPCSLRPFASSFTSERTNVLQRSSNDLVSASAGCPTKLASLTSLLSVALAKPWWPCVVKLATVGPEIGPRTGVLAEFTQTTMALAAAARRSCHVRRAQLLDMIATANKQTNRKTNQDQ